MNRIIRGILLTIGLILIGGSAAAEPVYYICAAGNDANDGLTEASAFKTLAQGIAQAQSRDIRQIIVIGVLDGTSEGPGPDRDSIFHISDSGESEILITGSPERETPELRGSRGSRVIAISGNSKIRLEHILITGGNTGLNGGGIYVEQGAVLTAGAGAAVQSNRAREGGGIYVQNGVFTLENNAVLTGNAVFTDEGGGGVFVNSTFTMQHNAVISNNSGGGIVMHDSTGILSDNAAIKDNRCQYDGGGIASYRSKFTICGNAQVSGNQAGRYGGGIISASGNLLVTENALIADNQAQTDGGGVSVRQGSCIIQGNARIEGNIAGDDGGGVYNSGGNLTFRESAQVLNNTSVCGGGLCSENGAFSIVQDQAAVSGNKAVGSAQGGGGLCMGINASILMKGGEVRDNEAVNGGGVYIEGGSFKHSGGIITNNTAQRGGGVFKKTGKFILTKGETAGNSPSDIVDLSATGR